jgi:predicted Zn-dependent protease with MMP-like domain
VQVSEAEFEVMVADALDGIPVELAEVMDNVVLLIADNHEGEPDLLGLYEGIPLTERDSNYGGVLPDRITLYRLPITERCATRAQVVDEVRITVVHEIAHHFGIDDDRLHDLGWG